MGFAIRPKRKVRTLTRPVSINDRKNEPTKRIIANTVNV